MIHKASRLEVIMHGRADGRSAVKSAAYCARASYRDAHIGKLFNHTRKGGLLSHELVNWSGDAEALWNAAEKAETRSNARVVREVRPSLPADLPLAQQVQLVRSFSLWLRDKYGVAVQANIHAPRFRNPATETRLMTDTSTGAEDRYLAALFDPKLTNLNFHAHILMTTRQVDPETGTFGNKTRDLDHKVQGPTEVTAIRKEWEKRTNAALKKIGADARVDLRSYAKMTAAGDAPEGLIAQTHLGPRNASRSRRESVAAEDAFLSSIPLLSEPTKQAVRDKTEDADWDETRAGIRREAVRRHNDALWYKWALERIAKDVQKNEEGQRLEEAMTQREREKKNTQVAKRRLMSSVSHIDVALVLQALSQIDLRTRIKALTMAMASYLRQDQKPALPQFSEEIDVETWCPPSTPLPEPVFEIRRERVYVRAR